MEVSNIEKRFSNVDRSKTFNNIIHEFDLGTKAVLDIGCSNGEFLIHFGKQSVGVTIVHDEVEYGKTKGLDIRYGNIESDEYSITEKFDVIFANNLFEHLQSPHAFLRKVSTYVKPGGMLILGVPCIPRISSLLHFKKFRGSLASLHINFFTRETLVQTVERGGWKPVAARGFHFANPFIDRMLNFIYPHFYVVAIVDPEFTYGDKRMKELAGYSDVSHKSK